MGKKEKISPERKETVKYLLENYDIKTPKDLTKFGNSINIKSVFM